MRVDLGKVLQEKQPKHAGSKAQTLEISHCQCREAGEDVKWRVFSMSLEGRGCGAHPASPEVVQRLQAGERSESVCVCQPLASFRQCFSKKLCSNLWCLHSGMYRHGYVPTPALFPLPRTHFMERQQHKEQQNRDSNPLELSLLPFHRHPQGSPGANG